MKQLIPLLLSANTLTLTWLVGNRRTSGWVLGCIGQVMWFVFIFTWQVWGLLPLAIGLTIVYGRNLIRWRREQRAEARPIVAAEVECAECTAAAEASSGEISLVSAPVHPTRPLETIEYDLTGPDGKRLAGKAIVDRVISTRSGVTLHCSPSIEPDTRPADALREHHTLP